MNLQLHISCTFITSLIGLLSLFLMTGIPLKLIAKNNETRPKFSEDDKRNFAKLHLLNKKLPVNIRLDKQQLSKISQSSCRNSLIYLFTQFTLDPKVKPAMDTVAKGMQFLPDAYGHTRPVANPWKSKNGEELLMKMLISFPNWCAELPCIKGSYDNNLDSIQHFSWFYYHNSAGQDFVQGRDPNNPSEILEVGRKFTKDFTLEYGQFMDSSESAATIPEWVADPIIEIQDYQKQQAADYENWNQFFARELIIDTETQTIPSRPVTMPQRDYVVVAPTDCVMNSLVQVLNKDGVKSQKILDNPLQENTVLNVKGIPLSMTALMRGVEDKYKEKFIGGTGQSCALMPNTYHHFHAPVDGIVVHASIIKENTYGYYDWPNWVSTTGNVGGAGTDFNQFRHYQRGIIIIELKYNNRDENNKPIISTGYVAVIPVGLETIGSLVFKADIKVGKQLKKGYTELGNFFYGGSLNILLYSKGLAGSSIQVRMGNQINVLKRGMPF